MLHDDESRLRRAVTARAARDMMILLVQPYA